MNSQKAEIHLQAFHSLLLIQNWFDTFFLPFSPLLWHPKKRTNNLERSLPRVTLGSGGVSGDVTKHCPCFLDWRLLQPILKGGLRSGEAHQEEGKMIQESVLGRVKAGAVGAQMSLLSGKIHLLKWRFPREYFYPGIFLALQKSPLLGQSFCGRGCRDALCGLFCLEHRVVTSCSYEMQGCCHLLFPEASN